MDKYHVVSGKEPEELDVWKHRQALGGAFQDIWHVKADCECIGKIRHLLPAPDLM